MAGSEILWRLNQKDVLTDQVGEVKTEVTTGFLPEKSDG